MAQFAGFVRGRGYCSIGEWDGWGEEGGDYGTTKLDLNASANGDGGFCLLLSLLSGVLTLFMSCCIAPMVSPRGSTYDPFVSFSLSFICAIC